MLTSVYHFRAQLRVAQQREESRLPLGKIIDTRKRVFAEVKVRFRCRLARLEG